ncbi:LysR family transcriptional regulator substrate-binding protein [Polaromonas sp. P1-6]|nr:LysR family transcriptional regulator substrate-binding protein [Polaromonas sp. P1-6]
MRPTEVGEAFLRYAERLDLGATDLYAAMRDLRQARAGVLRVGLGQGVPDRIVTMLARTMISGGVDLDLTGGMTDSLQRAVGLGELEFAIIGLTQAPSPGLEWSPLIRDPMQPIAPSEHPMASARRPVAWSSLARAKWIVPASGTSSFAEFQRNFRDRGLTAPRPCVESRNSHRELALAAAIGAIVLVPQSVAGEIKQLLQFVPVRPQGGWSSSRELGIIRRQTGYISAAARKGIDCVCEAAGG